MASALNRAFNEFKFFKIFNQISREVSVATVGMSTCTYVTSLVPNLPSFDADVAETPAIHPGI